MNSPCKCVGAVVIVFSFLVGCESIPPSEGPVASVVTLTISSEPQVTVDGEPIDLAELEATLRANVEKRATYVVYDIAPDAPAATFQDVFRQVRNAGVTGVRFAGADATQTFYRPTLAAR